MARLIAPHDRSEEVYAAALRLFREKGYHATSMQDIAAAVGLYKGSLYYYIGGKEDLLVRVFERGLGTLLQDVERIVDDSALTPRKQLRMVIEAHVRAVADNLDALTVYLHEFRALGGGSLETVREQRERYVRLVAEIIARGVRLGEFATPDVSIATLALIGMCNWMCQWYQADGRLEPCEIARLFGDLLLYGLGGQPLLEPSTISPSVSPKEATRADE